MATASKSKAAATKASGDNGGSTRRLPDDVLKPAKEFPTAQRTVRRLDYHDLMVKVARGGSDPTHMRHFYSPDGASIVAKSLRDGDKLFPGNDAVEDNWVIQSFRVDVEDEGGNTVKESDLWVQFIGSDIEALIEAADYLS